MSAEDQPISPSLKKLHNLTLDLQQWRQIINEEDKGKIVLRRFERLVDALKRNENNKKKSECLCETE